MKACWIELSIDRLEQELWAMKIHRVITVLGVFLVSGCAVQKDWVATGGSRADATVRLSYEYGAFESPQVSDAQADMLAAQRCKTWGYEGAEPFGGITQVCNLPDGLGGCNRWLVTKEFQCMGTGAK